MSFYKQATGYIIHQRNFKNNSLIIEFFSKEFGKFQVVAKGIKSNKLLSSQTQFFSLAKIHFFGGSDLKTLTSINLLEEREFENVLLKTSALYLNELVHLNIIENENTNQLFKAYQKAIENLGKDKLFTVLRTFEWQLLKFNGFEISLNDIDSQYWISMHENHELKYQESESQNDCKVMDLLDFLAEKPLDKASQRRINKFMENMISICFSHRKIYSKELIKSLLKVC